MNVYVCYPCANGAMSENHIHYYLRQRAQLNNKKRPRVMSRWTKERERETVCEVTNVSVSYNKKDGEEYDREAANMHRMHA